MKSTKQKLAMGIVLTGVLMMLASTAMAQDRYRDHRRWNNHYYQQNDWNRNYPSVYVAPGYVYYPPPVVYAPPPVHPGFGFYFGF